MGHLVFFVLLFAGQVIGGSSTQKLPQSDYGNTLTILSIDGGGIRGIIPATVLDYLDQALKAKDPNADLAHYFDVIGGTSTGALITAMLATPSHDDPTRGAFTPAQIVDFYKQNGPHVFNSSRPGDGPQFDGEFLHNLTRQVLKDTRLSQTLTNVVIPTFDIKTQKPVIFSSYKVEKYPYFNALMSDICISASAVPTILPPYCFQNGGVDFNLISGAELSMFEDSLVDGNPTGAAVAEILRYNEFSKILVLSLGTGTPQTREIYDVAKAATWKPQNWIVPLFIFLDRASTAMAEYYHSSLGQKPTVNYLRIQEYSLDLRHSSMTNVGKLNMKSLETTGKNLLNETVKEINLDTFDIKEGNGTNAAALDSIADILYGERQHRLKQKSTEKGGRPFHETLRVPSDKTEANWAFQKSKVM